MVSSEYGWHCPMVCPKGTLLHACRHRAHAFAATFLKGGCCEQATLSALLWYNMLEGHPHHHSQQRLQSQVLCCRHVCLMDKPAAFAASAGARANSTGLSSFLSHFPADQIVDCKQQKLLKPSLFQILTNDTLESYLLKNWHTGHRAYDAVFINSLSNSTQVLTNTALTVAVYGLSFVLVQQ